MDALKLDLSKLSLTVLRNSFLGHEMFKSVARSNYRGASGSLVVYDITNRDSFTAIIKWLSDVRNLAGTNLPAILVGNKKDLTNFEEFREVSYMEAEAFAKKNDMKFFETSAMNGEHIEEAFVECVRAIFLLKESGELPNIIIPTSHKSNHLPSSIAPTSSGESNDTDIRASVMERNKVLKIDKNGEQYVEMGKSLDIKCKEPKHKSATKASNAKIDSPKEPLAVPKTKVLNAKVESPKEPGISEEVGGKLMAYFASHPSPTLLEMQVHLYTTCNTRLTLQIIADYLKVKVMNRRFVGNGGSKQNHDWVKEMRQQYVSRLLKEKWRSSQTIFIGTISLQSWWVSKKAGAIKTAEEFYAEVFDPGSPLLSLILGISKKGLVHLRVLVGLVHDDVYRRFLCAVSRKIPDTRHYLVHDNPFVYNNSMSILSMHTVVNLPSHSPFLSPIETVIMELKSRVRKDATKMAQSVHTSLSKRAQKIEKFITAQLSDISFEEIISYNYHNVKRHFPQCILKQDVL